MQNLLQETKFILNKYQLKANKNLGQNFLIDANVVEKIVEAANIDKQDLVIEIGPGLGTLTKELLEKSGRVLCIELDSKMITILQDRFAMYKNIDIIHEDVLNLDLKKIIKEKKEEYQLKTVKIVANLPYYITTPIVMKLLEEDLDIESITIMIQKEVADRLVAEPGTALSGSISYAINYYTEPEVVLEVPNTAFLPAPQVDSEVIKLKIRKEPAVQVKNKNRLFQLIKIAFMQRRKTLINALYNGKIMENKHEIEHMLLELNIDIKTRGEKLSLEQFTQISDYIEERKK